MSNPPTLYRCDDLDMDLSDIFTPGSSSVVTGYKLTDNADLGTIFSDISGATGLGYPIGFRIKNYDGITGYTKDLSEIFAVNPLNFATNIQSTGLNRYNIDGAYTILYFNSSSIGTLLISGLRQFTIDYSIVGGGGAGGNNQGGGGGGGQVINGSLTINRSGLITISVGKGGTVTSNTVYTAGEDSTLTYNSITLRAKGGGYGGTGAGARAAGNGASGGGAAAGSSVVGLGISGVGNNGGAGAVNGGGGGGGCATAGGAAVANSGGGGGGYAVYDILNIHRGGGGGGGQNGSYYGGPGGGGGGGQGGGIELAVAGQDEFGGGGGGGRNGTTTSGRGAPGGGGVVILKYLSI
jgi:hypothetical protein